MPIIKTKKTNKLGEIDTTTDLKTGKCVFPFVYYKKTYKTCHEQTKTKKGAWCATDVDRKTNKMVN